MPKLRELGAPRHFPQIALQPARIAFWLPRMFTDSFPRLASVAQTAIASPLSEDVYAANEKRTTPNFPDGEPIDGKGKGAPILGKLPDSSHFPIFTNNCSSRRYEPPA